MNSLLSLALASLAALTLSCSTSREQAFFPDPPQVRYDRSTLAKSNVREGYRTFDRKAVLAKIEGDDRYPPLVERARKSVEKLVSMDDESLRALICPADYIRALMVHRKGCPVHGGGTSVYQPFGTTVDLDYPLQVKCPIGGEVYPNAEFPDDGSGWLDDREGSPTKGEKYYFIGWFNHWFLQSMPSRVKTMARLWLITGDDRYAHKATVLLDRFMEVYPDMDGDDLTYDGTDWGVYVKMLPTMWEGAALSNLVSAVEILLPTLDDAFIERFHANVFRPAFEAYREHPAPSNWGNVWNAPFARFVNKTGDEEILDYMLYEHPVAVLPTLDNQYFRDGFPYEAAFGYGSHYLYDDWHIAEEMGANGDWIWEHPNLRSAFHAFAGIVILDKYTHFFGDTGGIKNNGLTLRPALLLEAYRRYKTPVIARYLLQAYNLYGFSSTVSLDNLFTDDPPKPDMEEIRETAAKAGPFRSTLAPVRGFAVMRTGEGDDRAALFFDYGYAHAAHSHADRLNINLFALDREFIPEMGYPEYMDSIAPTPGGWTTHTVCHATVEVDGKRQLEGVFGDLHAFVHADGVKIVDASCEDAYVHCGVDLYRRSLALIDIPGGAYAADIFRVRGGDGMHDYLFHGPPVDVKLYGVSLSPPRKGTLAGEDVAFGWKPDNVLPYHVDNMGYQYLYDVQTCEKKEPYSASWTMDDGVAFSAVFIPGGTETFHLTKGYPRPSSKSLPPMPFLVRRSVTDGPDDTSIFASVLSYARKGDTPLVIEAKRIDLSPDSDRDAFGLLVKHRYGKDIILSTLSPTGYAASADGRFELRGQYGVASWRDGRPTRLTLVGGTLLRAGGTRAILDSPGVEATVRQVYHDRLVLDRELPHDAVGQVILADRSPVQSAYWVRNIEGNAATVSPGTWIGRGRVDRYDAAAGTIYDSRDVFPLGEKRNRLADISGMKYPEGNRNYYAGSWLVATDGSAHYRLERGGHPGFVLDKSQDLTRVEKDFPVGSGFLLYDV
ncbi:MAG: heparinase II/III family protein, partial [Candidatus Latescibacteria bacterium]|nr:heparinase II/III family protein [Candidatus Latescibacterota bacterium]